SSSFSPIPTSFRSFERWDWLPDKPSDSDGLGYGEACRPAAARGVDRVARLFSNAEPSSPATAKAWDSLTEQILGGLKQAMPVDIVFLCLHGAQMSEGIDDCEGEVLAATRAIVGPKVAIGVLLDLHANVTLAMCTNADLTVSRPQHHHVHC